MTYNLQKGCYRIFNVRAILMWTVHDYPRYNDVSKYHVSLICGTILQVEYRPHLKKMVYKGHNKFLPMDHQMRGGD